MLAATRKYAQCLSQPFVHSFFFKIVRGERADHYASQQHQQSVLNKISQVFSCVSSTSLVNVDFRATTATDTLDEHDFMTLSETVTMLLRSVETFQNDDERFQRELLQSQLMLQKLRQECSQIKVAIEESQNFESGSKLNRTILDQDLASLKDRIEDMRHVCYDGTYIWRITGVREKMRKQSDEKYLDTILCFLFIFLEDAQSERQSSVYSPPFYSSPTGYKMRIRAYLNGDGNARSTHMSLFFVLMRGEHDAILKFPFTYKVTFCLYDQTTREKAHHRLVSTGCEVEQFSAATIGHEHRQRHTEILCVGSIGTRE